MTFDLTLTSLTSSFRSFSLSMCLGSFSIKTTKHQSCSSYIVTVLGPVMNGAPSLFEQLERLLFPSTLILHMPKSLCPGSSFRRPFSPRISSLLHRSNSHLPPYNLHTIMIESSRPLRGCPEKVCPAGSVARWSCAVTAEAGEGFTASILL